jgi:hypothetical protein
MPDRSNVVIVDTCGENVFVSWTMLATPMRTELTPSSRRRQRCLQAGQDPHIMNRRL